MNEKLFMESDKYKLRDKLTGATCDTCTHYEEFINTSFYCLRYKEVILDTGKSVCASWESIGEKKSK